MGDLIVSLTGTATGRHVALGLALLAAVLHALFGALQKGRHDPWLSRAAIDLFFTLFALPFIVLLPMPEPHLWPLLAGAFVIHAFYKYAQAITYTKGAYTVVYPVVRGTGPLFAVIGAGVVFCEVFSVLQWVGVLTLLGGIYGLAAYNLRNVTLARDTLVAALMWAVVTGLFVALYTTYDAYGVRATANPFTFLAWFFFFEGFSTVPIGIVRWIKHPDRPTLRPLMSRGMIGAVVGYFSFGSIMIATRLDSVGQAAVLRETSTVFAAFFGWVLLKERVGPRRLALMGLIALGAVIVEFGGA